MRSEIYSSLVLAVACNLDADEAYEMLQNSYIDGFTRHYEELQRRGGEVPNALDALIIYTMKELPIESGLNESILYKLKSKRADIVHTFINENKASMITRLASRACILSEIRQYLKVENKQPEVYPLIESNRAQSVFVWFLRGFKENSARAYAFTGNFKAFVMHCFKNYFYIPNKRDIWNLLKEGDYARRDLEQNVVSERVLTTTRTDDLRIHDILIHISETNDKFFSHSGQSKETYGVQYDIYYLLLCYLCERRIKRINEALGSNTLVFDDPLDRKACKLGVEMNKGIAAKIANAKEMVPVIFEYVRAGKLNVSNIADLRKTSFRLGKRVRESKICVWNDVQGGAETSYYLDIPYSMKNYSTFDTILKGVASAYTLMIELDARGIDLIESYDASLFQDENIIRYMDYLSSVPYIPLMRELQSKPVDRSSYTKELLEFPEMLDVYAGSAGNNETHIRENRFYALTHGFISNPRIKQTSALTTLYDNLATVATGFSAIPRSREEFLYELQLVKSAKVVEHQLSSWIALPSSDVVEGKYNKLRFNSFITNDLETAQKYLAEPIIDKEGVPLLLPTNWSVGFADYEGFNFANMPSVYLPLQRRFAFYADADGKKTDTPEYHTLASIQAIIDKHTYMGVCSAPYSPVYGHIVPQTIFERWMPLMFNAMKFPVTLGFSNILEKDVQDRFGNLRASDTYKKYVSLYHKNIGECSKLQHTFVDILKTMFVECVVRSEDYRYSTGERTLALELLHSMANGVFKTESLEWFIDTVAAVRNSDVIQWSAIPGKAPTYRPLDTWLVSILKDCQAGKQGNYKDYFFYPVIKNCNTIGEAFVALYNFLYTRLDFLMLLRDSFSLLLETNPLEASALICELNYNFKVIPKLTSYKVADFDYGVKMEHQSYTAVQQDIWSMRVASYDMFSTLIDSLANLVRTSEQRLSTIASCDIAVVPASKTRFTRLADFFATIPKIRNVPVLDELRQIASVDSAGFLVLNGSYFKGRSNNSEFYVHSSGHMAVDGPGGLEYAYYDVHKESDLRMYCAAIQNGLDRDGK